ncbi:MAG: hypothetical protein HW387_901 [Parachlamydiales bacterium]|nr:hypothetical protein [Parachlamydiales bacterium]
MGNQDEPNQMMMMNDSMNTMMMDKMYNHHMAIYAFSVLVLIGLTISIVLLYKILKQLRKI